MYLLTCVFELTGVEMPRRVGGALALLFAPGRLAYLLQVPFCFSVSHNPHSLLPQVSRMPWLGDNGWGKLCLLVFFMRRTPMTSLEG